MTGPSTYVFTLKTDAKKNYSVAKGDYKVKVYACGGVFTRNFTADKNAKLKIICP
jgi:roadblock/LC7 domain-containing protein